MKRALSLIVAIVMLCSSLVMAPAAVAADDPVVTRFVVVSDVHTNPVSPTNTIDRLPKVFSTAYAYAESQGGKIDAFVFNGDSINGNETSKGYTNEDEMGIFLKGIKDNVKEGSKVLLAMARTHDIYDGDGNIYYVQESELNALIAEHLGTDGSIIPTADWGYAPHMTMVGGVPVITLTNDIGNGNVVNTEDDGNANNDDNADNSYHDSEAWLDTQLAALTAENPERAIFVVFHYPEVGKLGWTQRWGQNSLRDTLDKYPQVIAVNAHVHWDPRNVDSIAQDRFTEVYDGAVRDAGGWGAGSTVVSYSVIEVTESGAVTVKYIDPETGNFLQEANGSGETLTYSIPKAWDRSTYLYTDEQKFAVDEAVFAADASIKLQNGTLTFDRAESEHPVLRYNVAIHDGKVTKTYTVSGDYLGKTLPATFSTKLALKTGIDYTITVTAVDGLFRESANALVLTGNINDPEKVLSGTATAVAEKTYGGNGTKGEYDYPDFKTYATTPDAEGIANWGISDAEDLAAWSDFSKTNNCLGLTFHLENDIDMKDEIFNMIGSLYVPFKGTFDGHLHTLSNLFISDTSGMGTGFFVYAVDATIRNFGIKNGQVYGHVSNRKYENAGTYNLSGTKRTAFTDVIGVAAIAGRADNTDFTHVWNGADVSFHADKMAGFANPCIAGLVGRAQSNCTFVGCYNTGDVHGLDRASGFANWAQNGTYIAQFSNCFNLGKITTETGANTEAIARYNTVNTADLSYFNYNNYYLEGSADIATNRASDTGYTANGAEEPVAITADEVTELATLLNEKRFSGLLIDTATWATGEDGVPYVASLSENAAEQVVSISTPAELSAFATASKTNSYEGYTIILKNNIDMSGVTDFAMIGSESVPFKGTFDGNGLTISNLTFAAGTKKGLFVQITNGTVKNLTVSNFTNPGGENCGILAYKLTENVLFQNVHIKNSSIVATGNANGGFAAAAVNGGSYKIHYCTVDGLTVDGFTNLKQQTAGFVAGSGYGVEIDHCIIKNSTVSAHRNGGLLVSYANGTTVKNLISYGNTVKGNYSSVGLVGGQLQNPTTLENCVFYPTAGAHNVSGGDTAYAKNCTTFYLVGYTKTDKKVTATNVYTTAETDTTTTATVISTTEAKLNSGEVAYALGWAMKDGKLAFADKNNAAAKRYTYKLDADTTEYRYTDSTGAIINGAPVVTAEDFLGWTSAKGEKEGDLVYTATYGTEDNGSYPITEFENRPKATKFTVSTPEELNVLAALSKTHTFEGRTITLLNDIDMSGTENFAMIGSESCRFTANFDGGNHTIYNVTINSTAAYAGFFSMTGVDKTKNVTIKNLTLEDASVNGGESSAILIGKAYGVTTLENVKLRYSTVISNNTTVGGFFGKVDANTASFTVKNCVAESCKVTNLASSKQQAGLIVGGNPYNVSVENVLLRNNIVEAHRQVGLVTSFAANNLKINGLIAYGNTINCNYDSAGIIGRGSGVLDAQNVIAYNNSGLRNKSGSDTITGKNSGVYWMLGRYDSDKPTVTGSNLYIDEANDTTMSPVTVTTVTAEQIKSGAASYLLGLAYEDGNIAFPDSDTKAAVKYTYLVNGTVSATRYTDGAGKLIGSEVSLPEGFAEWTVTEAENGDKTFSVSNAYDPDGTYPISKFEIYPAAKKFSVSTAAEFKTFADLVNAGKIGADLTILQTADIDLKDYPNIEIGTGRDADMSKVVCFEATYDGQNHKLLNYTFTATTYAHGLFKNLAGTVKNLIIENANFSTMSHSGIVAGETYGTNSLIENVHIKNSTITASQRRVAFFVYGYMGTGATVNIKNCTVTGSTLNTGTTAGNPVGLITIRDEVAGSVIENTYAYGNTVNVQATGVAVSGIVADGRQTVIHNCGAFNNTYTGKTPSAIFGIDGTSNTNPTVSNCFTDEANLTNKTHKGSNNYAGVTDTEIADGSLAYKLKTTTDANWVQTTYPQVGTGSAVTKITYMVDDAEYAVLYTDKDGKAIGTVADPKKAGFDFVEWTLSAEEEGDKVYVAAFEANNDLDGDGMVTTADAILILQHLVGKDVELDLVAADRNGDGKVSIYDVVVYLRMLAK